MMQQEETQVSWQDYLALVVRRRNFFLVPCLAILFGALVVGMFLPKIYRAHTTILVQEANIMNPLIEGLAVSTSVGSRLGLLREEILSWTSLRRLIHDLKMDEEINSPLGMEALVRKLQQDIRVRMRGRNLILISYENPDPKLAQTLVNSISSIFLERNLASQASETDTAIAFLEGEMKVYQEKLEGSERSLREFRELYLTQMPVAVELNNQIVDLELERAELLVENTERHPAVVAVNRRIHDMKERRDEEIKHFITTLIVKGQDPKVHEGLLRIIGTDQLKEIPGLDPKKIEEAQKAYESWIQRLDQPTQDITRPAATQVQVMTGAGGTTVAATPATAPASRSVSISLAPWQEQEMARLTRDYDVIAGTYQHLQQRLERARITEHLGESDEGLKFKVLEPARLPLRPVRPNLMKIGFFALLLGAFVGAGAAFAAEYLDQSFQSAQDLQAVVGLPVLGSISTIVTEGDLEVRRQRRNYRMSIKGQFELMKKWVLLPVGRRFDALLVRWKV